jgi:hypothetical protein
VKPKKRCLKLGSCTKMVARFCGTFEILEKIGLVPYMLALPASMNVHNAFHVYLLNKYVHDTNHAINWHLIQVDIEGYFQGELVHVLDRKVKMFRNRVIQLGKVQWTYYSPEDVTWEHEYAMRAQYP